MRKQNVTNRCIECGKPFVTTRVDAKFDSANCRLSHWRKEQKAKALAQKYTIDMLHHAAWMRVIAASPEFEGALLSILDTAGKDVFYSALTMVDAALTLGGKS